MKKRTVLCFLICTLCVFYSSMPNPALGQGVSLAQQVYRKHNRTLQRADVQEVLPQVLKGLKAPDTQALLNPRTINAVVNNPDLLPLFIPEIEPRFVALLKRDQTLKDFLRDPLVQRLLQSPAAIDELSGLLGVGAQRPQDLPAQQIYDQAIHSVVWIATGGDNWLRKGSGVLIDKRRRLVVTNEHVVRNAERISVFFPFKQNGGLVRDEGFYFKNWEWLDGRGFHTKVRVVARNVKSDLAIVQLDRLSPSAREIKHDFSRNVEDSMQQRDKVHILGNPGDRLWNWTQGTFLRPRQVCLIKDRPLVGCLEMEGDAEPGNSGGPILNGQGTLIGILTAGGDDTVALAAPARNIRALLKTVPARLVPVPPQRTHPKRVFKIRNHTGVTVHYQIKWSNINDWQSNSLKTGFIRTHRSGGQQVPANYPKIQFDHIAGDQRFTGKTYRLGAALLVGGNADGAPTYFFRYNRRGDRLDLFRDVNAAPTLSRDVSKQNALFANYPNPFNPETWIPYQLAEPAEVKVTIYAADGTLVRTLSLGHQSAGVYQSKGRAAYWDGRNAQGEPVASGVYFYTLTAGEFRATRKLLIQK